MIRQHQPADLDAIIDIWLRASMKAHDFAPPEFWQKHSADMRSKYIPGSETWVYEHDGRVVGFFSLVDENLAALFVEPEMQGTGFGPKLLQKAKSLRGKLELCVYTLNTRAMSFYLKQGFKEEGRRTDTHTGVQESIMAWNHN